MCRSDALELGEPILTMKGSKGIENPAFVASSPDTPHRLFASPSHVEVSDLAIKSQGPNSKPQEPPESQTSPEAPQPSAAPSASQELSRPESPPEFEEGPCGCGNLQPQCLRPCNTPQGFLLFYCLLALTQGKVQRRLERALAPRGTLRDPAGARVPLSLRAVPAPARGS